MEIYVFQIDFIFSSFVYLCYFHIGTDKILKETKKKTCSDNNRLLILHFFVTCSRAIKTKKKNGINGKAAPISRKKSIKLTKKNIP